MPDVDGFEPRWSSPPGESIRDLSSRRGLSEDQIASMLSLDLPQFDALLRGDKRITDALAKRLSSVLGYSSTFWLKRDNQFIADTVRLTREAEGWVASLPMADMIRFGWVPQSRDRRSKASACLEFFGVQSVEEWEDRWGHDGARGAAFRTSPTYRSNAPAVSAWLRQGEKLGEGMTSKDWSAVALRAALPALRQLTRLHDPSRFLPALQSACAECGVAVCVVRSPAGCKASGATRFISPSKSLVMLSFRYLSDDHFWFTFFHEIGHLLLHTGQSFLEGGGEGEFDSKMEEEANAFSAALLIPAEFDSGLMNAAQSYENAIRYAKLIGVSPGILVGQLQHRGIIGRDRLNRLKRRFSWDV